MTTLFDVSAADVATTTDDYYTPRWIFDAAGLTFDMDVAAPVDPDRRTCPAKRYLSPVEDGLSVPWDGAGVDEPAVLGDRCVGGTLRPPRVWPGIAARIATGVDGDPDAMC